MEETAKASPDKAVAGESGTNPFEMLPIEEVTQDEVERLIHVMKPGFRCITEQRGHETPRGRSPFEIVVDASEGFIPLWEQGSILRWRINEGSLRRFRDPKAAEAAIEDLFARAVMAWEDAAPVKFTKNRDAWDFEIVVRQRDDCTPTGCVLASAFFPDAGRHQLDVFPKMFEQDGQEQLETLIHEVGHIFGLRHFFAQISELPWPSEVFGRHVKFTIMNYGSDSVLTDADKADLKELYEKAWSGALTEINGTEIRLVRPYHASGTPARNLAALQPAARS